MIRGQSRASQSAGRYMTAAEWLMRLRESADLSAGELQAWQEFIDMPENREALELVQHISDVASVSTHPQLPSAAALSEDEYDGSVPIRQWKKDQERAANQLAGARRSSWSFKWWIGMAVIATGAAAAMGFWLRTSEAPGVNRTFQTAAAEQRTVRLPDGSSILLGAQTTVEVQFTGRGRTLHLDRGEALFTVAQSPNRPFRVYVGKRSVTALGTEFNIWRDLDRTTVTVAQGAVEVSPIIMNAASDPTTPPGAHPARMVEGQALTYSEDGSSSGIQVADVAAATAWRDGRLVYRHVPLRYVIADVNRYFKEQFLIEDFEVGGLPFSGAILQTQSASEVAHALESVFPLQAVPLNDGRVLLRPRPPALVKRPVVRS